MWHAVELNPDGQIINKSHILRGCLSELLYEDSAREVLESSDNSYAFYPTDGYATYYRRSVDWARSKHNKTFIEEGVHFLEDERGLFINLEVPYRQSMTTKFVLMNAPQYFAPEIHPTTSMYLALLDKVHHPFMANIAYMCMGGSVHIAGYPVSDDSWIDTGNGVSNMQVMQYLLTGEGPMGVEFLKGTKTIPDFVRDDEGWKSNYLCLNNLQATSEKSPSWSPYCFFSERKGFMSALTFRELLTNKEAAINFLARVCNGTPSVAFWWNKLVASNVTGASKMKKEWFV